jgi:hypothetical protein
MITLSFEGDTQCVGPIGAILAEPNHGGHRRHPRQDVKNSKARGKRKVKGMTLRPNLI